MHVAGIIPVAGQKLNFSFPWADCLQPIAQNYLAIERAAFECACAGCDTIWISCPYGIQPLVRYRLGDYVVDPLSQEKIGQWREPIKKIPIYYIPINPRDYDKRDSLVWSIIHGIFAASKISNKFSKYLIPEKFYVSFPYGVFPTASLLRQRKNIKKYSRFFISYDELSIQSKGNEYLSFTLNYSEFKQIKNKFLEKATGLYDSNSTEFKIVNNNKIPIQRLSINDRHSGRFLTLSDIFNDLNMTDSFEYKLPWYYNIDSWGGLCHYLGTEHRKLVQRPKRNVLKYCELDQTVK